MSAKSAEIYSPRQHQGGLHFKLNPFVAHAFSSGSSQGPVFWCLNQIAALAEFSRSNSERCFAFAPALDIFIDNKKTPETDIDIVANINGQFLLAEVKSSFKGVDEKLLGQLYWIGEQLRPDIVLLAIHEKKPETFVFKDNLIDLHARLRMLDVRFELLSLDNEHQTLLKWSSIAQPYGEKMRWSAW